MAGPAIAVVAKEAGEVAVTAEKVAEAVSEAAKESASLTSAAAENAGVEETAVANPEVTCHGIDDLPNEVCHGASKGIENLPNEVEKVHPSNAGESVGKTGETNAESGSVSEAEGEKVYTDDKGNVYRKGDDLVPNSSYEINGYKYTTDSAGRISSAEGKLRLKTHEGRYDMPDKIDKVGKGDQLPTDNRGHAIADQFDGSGGMENLTPQDAKLNGNEIKNLEDNLAKEIKNGNDVYLKVEPKYEAGSFRPVEYHYSYTINGEKFVKVFKNGGA